MCFVRIRFLLSNASFSFLFFQAWSLSEVNIGSFIVPFVLPMWLLWGSLFSNSLVRY